MDRCELEERQRAGEPSGFWEDVLGEFGRGTVALQSYISAIGDEKSELLKSIGSDFIATRKTLVFPMVFPFVEIREWRITTYGDPTGSRTPLPSLRRMCPNR
jgi:hypothetical protein